MPSRILVGEVRARLRQLPDESIHCCVTSPPYLGLRSYHTAPVVWGGDPGFPGDAPCEHVWGDLVRRTGGSGNQGETSQRKGRGNASAQRLQRTLGAFCTLCGAWLGEHGREPSIDLWLAHEVEIWREIRRVLRKDGVAFLNIGDAYANDGKWGGETGGKQAYLDADNLKRVGREKRRTGLPAKSRMLLPERLIIALQDDGWIIRDTIVWYKPNPMPSSVTDRTTPAHEMLYMLTRRSWYFWDGLAIAEPASFESELRYHRERSDTHKWADGGPGNQTIAKSLAHMRAPVPSGWDRENTRHDLGQYRGRAAGNKRHKFTEEFASSTDAADRPKARLLEIAHTAYGLRNKRSVWSIATEAFPEAHFATFPTALVEPCILAGTSHRGACPDCGTPWRRIIRRAFVAQWDVSAARGVRGAEGQKPMPENNGWDGFPRGTVEQSTLGWYPACRCAGLPALPKAPVVKRIKGETDARWLKRRERELGKWQKMIEPHVEAARRVRTAPCVVIDPFLGSGTTCLVADRLGRDSIGIELNKDFAEMAAQRMAGEASLFAPRVEE